MQRTIFAGELSQTYPHTHIPTEIILIYREIEFELSYIKNAPCVPLRSDVGNLDTAGDGCDLAAGTSVARQYMSFALMY